MPAAPRPNGRRRGRERGRTVPPGRTGGPGAVHRRHVRGASRASGGDLRQAIDDELALFIEGCPFFFVASADADGRCDCSFKGSEGGPAVRVVDSRSLVFPDYRGNGLFNTLGNILANPHLGLLFIDFAGRLRLRVNGRAAIEEPDAGALQLWPDAQCLVRVAVEQVYWNCPKRIPTDPRLRSRAP